MFHQLAFDYHLILMEFSMELMERLKVELFSSQLQTSESAHQFHMHPPSYIKFWKFQRKVSNL